jgi:hypothetical protein
MAALNWSIYRPREVVSVCFMANLRRRVFRGLKWQSICIIGRQLLSFRVFTTLTRLLEPFAFGLVGLVSVCLGFVSMFAEQAIGTALIQRQRLTSYGLLVHFLCSAVLCLGTIVFAQPVAALLDNRTRGYSHSWRWAQTRRQIQRSRSVFLIGIRVHSLLINRAMTEGSWPDGSFGNAPRNSPPK